MFGGSPKTLTLRISSRVRTKGFLLARADTAVPRPASKDGCFPLLLSPRGDTRLKEQAAEFLFSVAWQVMFTKLLEEEFL